MFFVPRLRCAHLGLLRCGIFDAMKQQVTSICILGSHVVAVAGFKPARSIARGKARETSDATRGGIEMALPLHDRSTSFAVVAAQHRRCDISITPHVSVG